MMNQINQFNMLIVGTGGQGQITLLQVLAEAALTENLDFRSSELHGLSQRGGSVEVHIRFGREIHSPMVSPGKVDFILGLEAQEGLAALNFAGHETKLLVNQYVIPFQGGLAEKDAYSYLEKAGRNVFLSPASEICRKELATDVVAGIYLISLAAFNKLIPLKPSSIQAALKKIIPEKFLELNLKAFNLAGRAKDGLI
jgi:indolepyruvate ferredoxin oxidoreductase, beta subunit